MRLLRFASKLLGRIQVEYRCGLWWINRRFRKSLTVSTKQGVFTLPLDIDDSISRSLYIHGEYELNLIADAMPLIRKLSGIPKGKGIVLDVGANTGVISIGMLFTGEVERAIAVEPDPRNFSRLKHNVRQNHFDDRVVCLNCAMSDSRSTLEFEISDADYGDHRVRMALPDGKSSELFSESKRQVISVEADTLDNVIARLETAYRENISVVWVDVQGYEGYAFSGATKLISSGVPVMTEVWPYGIQRSGMSRQTFCSVVQSMWSSYWVRRRTGFVKYPIEVFDTLFDELGFEGAFENVILTR